MAALDSLGLKSAMAQGSLCLKIDPDTDCPQTKSEFIKAQAADTASSVDPPDPRDAQQSANSKGSVGISATFTNDFTVIAVPFGIPLLSFLTLDFSLPYISTEFDEGLGNAYSGVTTTYVNSTHTFGVSGSFGLRIPTGKTSLVGERRTVDRFFAMSVLIGNKMQQVLVSYLAAIRPPDNLNQNLGDGRNFFIKFLARKPRCLQHRRMNGRRINLEIQYTS